MGCHGGFSLDESTRRAWYNPEAILMEIDLRPGAVFADVGCGDGFFSVLAAQTVGKTGIVFALDSDPQAIARLQEKITHLGLQNIVATTGTAEKTVFCKACADVVFFSMVLHDFEDVAQVLSNAKKMLKPDGLLVDLDWKKAQMPFGPPFAIRFSEQDTMGLLKMTGFNTIKVKEVGPYHYLITAKSRSQCGI
jgi:ubiquinone/menaquinone biosynthesis C-methylase UbiE